MDESTIRKMLADFKSGELTDDSVIDRLKTLPFEDIGFASLDHHRGLRTGFPEVIFAQGKTPAQTAEIFKKLSHKNPVVMATRANQEHADAVKNAVPDAEYFELPRVILWHKEKIWRHDGDPLIAIVSAGTADLPVAEEAAMTAEAIGWHVDRMYDVGVAGLHRLLAKGDRLQRAKVIVVVAGMEGALASVVGGLVKVPVVAVPTSIGYGAAFGGVAALLSMLNSCATGVTVVNIDNGFGAGYFAALIAEYAFLAK